MILDKPAAGESVSDLLEAYPKLTPEGLRAAPAFAAYLLRAEIHVIPTARK